MRTIILNEDQLRQMVEYSIKENIYSEPGPQDPSMKKVNKPYSINPEQVKIVKNFLDKNYKKANLCRVGPNGMQQTVRIVGMLDPNNGEVLQNMYLDDLEDQLITQFQNMFLDKTERQLFMHRVVDDWFNDAIGPLGTLTVNHL